MVLYKVAQLGLGWAVFRIDGKYLAHIDGPYRSRRHALARQRTLENRERGQLVVASSAGAPAFDD
jgi:hypothetical protein